MFSRKHFIHKLEDSKIKIDGITYVEFSKAVSIFEEVLVKNSTLLFSELESIMKKMSKIDNNCEECDNEY